MKKQLLDRATAIYTVKVAAKTLNDEVVQASLDQIGIFRAKIKAANPEHFNEIINEINNWATTSPIVTESDILDLRPKLK